MDEKLLEIKNLSVAYDESLVIKNVNLDIYKGEVFCLVGESGSGKSTLIKAICRNKNAKITGGEIFFREQCISDIKDKEMASFLGCRIGLIQQNPEGAFNPLRKLSDQFNETVKSHGKKLEKEKLNRIFSTLNLKDMDRILKSRPYELSGGMNQRIAVAASFILEPELLLCDEITSALDVTTAIAVTDELLRLKNDMNVSIVLVTHNLGIAANIADRIGIMYKGKIVEIGATSKVLENPQHEYTKRLLQVVPKLKAI